MSLQANSFGTHDMTEIFSVLASISAALGLWATIYSYIKLRRDTASISTLIDKLNEEERIEDANLGDATDREIRKIVSYVNHAEDEEWKKAALDITDVIPGKNEDFLIFHRAFSDLDENDKKNVVNFLKRDDLFVQAKILRTILIHGHFHIHPIESAFRSEIHKSILLRAIIGKNSKTSKVIEEQNFENEI